MQSKQQFLPLHDHEAEEEKQEYMQRSPSSKSRASMCRGNSDKDLSIEKHLQDSFAFLNPFILFCPLWVNHIGRKHQKKMYRKSSCNVIGILITSLSLIIGTIILIFQAYTTLLNYNPNQFFHEFYYQFAWIFWMIARCISVYYFLVSFDYPWKKNDDEQNMTEVIIESENYKPITNQIRFTRYRMVLFVSLVIIGETVELFEYYSKCRPIFDHYFYFIYWICFKLMQIPMLTSQCVISVVFLKFTLQLKELLDTLKHKKVKILNKNDKDFKIMLHQYQGIRTDFKKQYTLSLQYFYIFLIAAEICNCWVGTDNLFNMPNIERNDCDIYRENTAILTNVASIGVSIVIFAEFVISSSEITDKFDKFETRLLEFYVDRCEELEFVIDSQTEYLYFLQFIGKYKLRVDIGGLSVSKRNVIRFIIAFAIAKTVSYSIYSYE